MLISEKISGRLTAVKGIACIMVFLSHLHGIMVLEDRIENYLCLFPLKLLWDGRLGVLFFFVLSGFFSHVSIGAGTRKEIIGHLLKKVMRLYPTFAISLILGSVICNWQIHYTFNLTGCTEWFCSFWKNSFSIKELLMQMTIIGIRDADLINPPVWTMGIEFKMILLSPIIIAFLHSESVKTVIIRTIGVFGVCIVGGWIFGLFGILRWTPIFLIGIMIGELYKKHYFENKLRQHGKVSENTMFSAILQKKLFPDVRL